jgi:multiple sugar transport system permease protein
MAYVVPLVAVAIVWRYMFEPSRIGLFNAILGALGLSPLRWLASPRTSLLSLAIVSIWKNIGYVLVIYLAGLQTIPDVFHEAAMIDGANRWQRFRHVTLPLLVPTILFALVLSTISAMMMFTEAFVLTIQSGQMPGGPLGSTTTMVLYIYQSAFSFQKEGYASAIAVILFVIILMITFVQFRVVRSRFEY